MSNNLILKPFTIFNQRDKNDNFKQSPLIITYHQSFIDIQHPHSDAPIRIDNHSLEPLFEIIKIHQQNLNVFFNESEEKKS